MCLEASIAQKAAKAPKVSEKAMTDAEEIRARVMNMTADGLSRGQMKADLLENVLRRKDGHKPADVQRLVDMILKEK